MSTENVILTPEAPAFDAFIGAPNVFLNSEFAKKQFDEFMNVINESFARRAEFFDSCVREVIERHNIINKEIQELTERVKTAAKNCPALVV